MTNIGIIGLGTMGFEVAKCLLEQKHTVFGYDTVPDVAQRSARLGVSICHSPANLASAVEVVLIIVPGPTECRQVIFGGDGIIEGAQPGLIIANMSTVDPSTNQNLAEELVDYNVILLDTPVLGLPSGAGSWAFPVGGKKTDFERIKPILCCLSGSVDRIFHVGNVGDANKLKLLNNLMFGAITACTAEIMAIAKHMGLSQKLLFEVALAANAGTISNLYKALAQRIIDDGNADPIFTIKLLKKDNALALDMVKKCDVTLPLAETMNRINEMACFRGYGNSDVSKMWKMFFEQW